MRRVADGTTRVTPSPSESCNHTVRCIVHYVTYYRITADRFVTLPRWVVTRGPRVIIGTVKRVNAFLSRSKSPGRTRPTGDRVCTYTHACVRVCAPKFTLHVGILHVPKCFAVCCSPYANSIRIVPASLTRFVSPTVAPARRLVERTNPSTERSRARAT